MYLFHLDILANIGRFVKGLVFVYNRKRPEKKSINDKINYSQTDLMIKFRKNLNDL